MNKSLFADLGLLILRLSVSLPMALQHGWPKLMGYSAKMDSFADPLGVGPSFSLALVIFAEFFCSIAIALGLFTRLAAIPPAFAMAVVVFVTKQGTAFGDRELPFLFLVIFVSLILLGPGQFSIGRLFGRKG